MKIFSFIFYILWMTNSQTFASLKDAETDQESFWNLFNLALYHKRIGDYRSAQEYLEKDLTVNKSLLPANHIDTGYTYAQLADVYRLLENYEEAKEYTLKAAKISQQYYSKDPLKMAYFVFLNALLDKDLKDYVLAEQKLYKVLSLYSDHYGQYSVEVGHVMYQMSQLKFLQHDFWEVFYYAHHAAIRLLANQHVDSYLCLEILADIYYQRKENLLDETYQSISQKYLKQALNQAIQLLPEDSLHIIRLQSKLRNCQ